jgi:hypothetical protein
MFDKFRLPASMSDSRQLRQVQNKPDRDFLRVEYLLTMEKAPEEWNTMREKAVKMLSQTVFDRVQE